ncbi:16S rRNA (uracil(1498)-N(3))-methyltransferase [Thalassobacillus sp. CUG 92003]|uniref:16S rRNA (uracil(1498)-N(3))-methyltransferase n=1 Tax=Thalassobacillus sp. CUG 92003 TaxID=2736641 RepID=UPI0015E6EAB2
MQTYFVASDQWNSESVHITGEDTHHISRVMRMSPGDVVTCIHPDGKAALCKITEIQQDRVDCQIVEWQEWQSELPIQVTVVQALGKHDKLDMVVQKGTELGADGFIPFQADRSIAKWDEKKAAKKVERLRKIAKEAGEQSGRTKMPEVEGLYTLQNVLASAEHFDKKVFAYEDEVRAKQHHALSAVFKETQAGESMMVVIGPEGGFSEREVEKMTQHGFQSVRLGRRILRTETAPLYFLSCVSYHYEELR